MTEQPIQQLSVYDKIKNASSNLYQKFRNKTGMTFRKFKKDYDVQYSKNIEANKASGSSEQIPEIGSAEYNKILNQEFEIAVKEYGYKGGRRHTRKRGKSRRKRK